MEQGRMMKLIVRGYENDMGLRFGGFQKCLIPHGKIM